MNTTFLTTFMTLMSFKGASQLAHWNVVGPNFYEYHLLFSRLYETLSGHVDTMAEQGRGTGIEIPASVFNSVPEVEWQGCQDLASKLLGLNTAYSAALMMLRDEMERTSNFGFVNVIEGFLTDTNTISYLLRSALDQL
jgi:starvation-inducible DNA-binding protein